MRTFVLFAILLNMFLMQCGSARAPAAKVNQIHKEVKQTVLVNRGGSSFDQPKDYIVTAYTAGYESTGKRPGDVGYGITASGTRAREGITCACSPEIKLGTRVYIEGLGYRVCEDRGSAIKGNRLDVYMDNLSAALKWGRQVFKVSFIQ